MFSYFFIKSVYKNFSSHRKDNGSVNFVKCLHLFIMLSLASLMLAALQVAKTRMIRAII